MECVHAVRLQGLWQETAIYLSVYTNTTLLYGVSSMWWSILWRFWTLCPDVALSSVRMSAVLRGSRYGDLPRGDHNPHRTDPGKYWQFRCIFHDKHWSKIGTTIDCRHYIVPSMGGGASFYTAAWTWDNHTCLFRTECSVLRNKSYSKPPTSHKGNLPCDW